MRTLLIAVSLMGCSATKPADSGTMPASTSGTLPLAVASAVPPATASAEASAKPPAPPATNGKNCCQEECNSDEKLTWDTCDGSELGKKIADEWQGLLTGYQYPRNAAAEQLKTAMVYVPQSGPIPYSCSGQGELDCLAVYTDEKAAMHSCDAPNPKAVPFQDILRQAALSKQTIAVSCLQFFKGIRPDEHGAYLE